MAEIQKGLAVAWSITTTPDGMQVQAIGAGVLRPTSQALTHDGDQVEHLDPATGDVKGITIFNRRSTLEMTLYPSSTTKDAAKIAARALPLKGTNMKIADADDSQLIGWWNVESATKNKEVGAAVTFNVTLSRWEGITANDPTADGTQGGYLPITS